MNCEQVRNSISGYVDDSLSSILCQAIGNHIKRCARCAGAVDQERQLVQQLADAPIPEPGKAFFERALIKAYEHHHASVRIIPTRFISAAAFVLLGVLLTVVYQGVGFAPFSQNTPLATQGPELTVLENEQLDIHLQVSVNNDVDNATMVIEVPQSLQIVGFEDVNVLKWQVALKKGKNVLALPVKARRQFNEDQISHLVARLDTGKQQKDFDIKVIIKSSQHHGQEALLYLRSLWGGDEYA